MRAVGALSALAHSLCMHKGFLSRAPSPELSLAGRKPKARSNKKRRGGEQKWEVAMNKGDGNGIPGAGSHNSSGWHPQPSFQSV